MKQFWNFLEDYFLLIFFIGGPALVGAVATLYASYQENQHHALMVECAKTHSVAECKELLK